MIRTTLDNELSVPNLRYSNARDQQNRRNANLPAFDVNTEEDHLPPY